MKNPSNDYGTIADFRLLIKSIAGGELLEVLDRDRSDEIIRLVFFSEDDDPQGSLIEYVESLQNTEDYAVTATFAQKALDLYYARAHGLDPHPEP